METQTGLGATTQGQLRRKTSQNWSYNAIMFSAVLTRRTCPTTPASTTSTLSGSLSPLPFSCFPLSYSPYFRGQFSRFHIRDGRGRYFFHGARQDQKSMRRAGRDKDSRASQPGGARTGNILHIGWLKLYATQEETLICIAERGRDPHLPHREEGFPAGQGIHSCFIYYQRWSRVTFYDIG